MVIPEKLKKEIKGRLSNLSEYSFDKSLFIEDKFLDEICAISSEINYEVAVLINRKGQVVDLSVGDKTSASMQVEGCDDGKYLGLRVIHTHPSGNSKLSNMDISFLKNKTAQAVKRGCSGFDWIERGEYKHTAGIDCVKTIT